MNALWLFALTGIGVAIWMSAVGRLVMDRGEELAELDKRGLAARTGLSRDRESLAEIEATLADARRDVEALDRSIAGLDAEIRALANRHRPIVRVLNGSADPSARNWIVRTADAEGRIQFFIVAGREARDAMSRVAATAPESTMVGAMPFKDWRRSMQDSAEAAPNGGRGSKACAARTAHG